MLPNAYIIIRGVFVMILDEESYQNLGVWAIINCICDYCGHEFQRSKRNIKLGRTILNKESCNKKDCVKKKREESQFIKYGVHNAGGLKSSRDKAIRTWEKNLGVKNPMYSQKCKDKIKNTCLKRYGKPSFLSTELCQNARKEYGINNADEIKEKAKNTCLEKYGVDHPRKNIDVLYKAQLEFLKKHGVKVPSQLPDHVEKREKTCLEKYGVRHPVMNLEIQEKIKDTCIKKYGKYPVNCYGGTEQEIKDFIESFGIKCNGKDRVILDGKEIDIFVPELSLAIEYCGLFWHNEMSPTPRDKNYHFSKFDSLAKKNIKLITIFEDEWLLKKNICKSILKSKLGIIDNKIFARKCSVSKIDKTEAKKFLQENHLQGACAVDSAYGLFHLNELVACITYGTHHRGPTKKIILNRMCCKLNYLIIGGFSKIFKYSLKDVDKEIITWSDNRWSDGDIYKKLGFVFSDNIPPDYSYYKNGSYGKKRNSKQSMKKSNTGCPKDMTERDWCLENNYFRIWDCGKIRWSFVMD
jgi:hypothetical protein